ncbi:hypothetical protein CLV58_101373 [Spirosoma oryzae]|uniref:Uncharacterized protein n=1 Tax=Spirosoma oryzae TaxID=1469603 RepID=A0A2T0TNR0_9BACT|nr:hypothetical protein [Spirosoma oryzae]PRY47305.1 hypothetical protein CLV58_101373 [Spirosoma oryzae]
MRFVQDIPHPLFRIGLYAWNGKYILKIDAGPYEQTYKVSDTDVIEETDILTMLDEPFLQRIAERFRDMDADWQATIERHELN